MYTLGINAAFHDCAAALVRDGEVLAAAEEERFTRVKHGKRPVPFTTWQLPYHAIDYCLSVEGLHLRDVDHIAYSFNPWLLLILVLAILPAFVGETHFAGQSYSLFYRWTPERRQLDAAVARLAATGMLFRSAHCPAPTCNPSRTSVLTGIPATVHGLYGNGIPFRNRLPDAITLPQHMRRHGYETLG